MGIELEVLNTLETHYLEMIPQSLEKFKIHYKKFLLFRKETVFSKLD